MLFTSDFNNLIWDFRHLHLQNIYSFNDHYKLKKKKSTFLALLDKSEVCATRGVDFGGSRSSPALGLLFLADLALHWLAPHGALEFKAVLAHAAFLTCPAPCHKGMNHWDRYLVLLYNLCAWILFVYWMFSIACLRKLFQFKACQILNVTSK